jgi:proline iminopeptidase
MSEGFVKTKAGKVWYSVCGEGTSGTPMLVVHGGPGFMTMPQVVSDFAAGRPVYF